MNLVLFCIVSVHNYGRLRFGKYINKIDMCIIMYDNFLYLHQIIFHDTKVSSTKEFRYSKKTISTTKGNSCRA